MGNMTPGTGAPGIESLEQRLALAAGAPVIVGEATLLGSVHVTLDSDGVLLIACTPGHDDHIEVVPNEEGTVEVDNTDPGPNSRVLFDFSDIKIIVAQLGDGVNTYYDGGVLLPQSVNSGAGYDSISKGFG